MALSIKETLRTHLETLKNDFLERFGETEENGRFIDGLRAFSDSMKAGENFEIKKGRFSGLLESMKKNLSGNRFVLEFEFSNLLLQIMTLERILATEFRRRLSSNKAYINEESVFLDSQILDKIESTTSYMKTLKAAGIETMERESLGWGAGIAGDGVFTSNTFIIVEKYAKLLEDNEQLKNLAQRIGHHSSTAKSKKDFGKSTKPSISIDGIYHSDNIKTILPSELVFKVEPRTEKEFLRKFADRQLLCYRPSPDKSASDGKEKDKGAIIICLDTSGSMHGIPEAISKAMTLLIIQNAVKEKREIFVISFSVKFETLKIENPEKRSEMKNIISFLSSSFHGGTDISAALDFAIKSLSDKKFKNADILTISDFVSSDLQKSTLSKIQSIKSTGTRFYAISINDRGNNNILKIMNETFIYKKDRFN